MTRNPKLMKIARAISGVMAQQAHGLTPAEMMNVMAAATGILYAEAFFPKSLAEDGGAMASMGRVLCMAAARRTQELAADALAKPAGSA